MYKNPIKPFKYKNVRLSDIPVMLKISGIGRAETNRNRTYNLLKKKNHRLNENLQKGPVGVI